MTKLFSTTSVLLFVLMLPQAALKPIVWSFGTNRDLRIANDICNAVSVLNGAVNPFLYHFYLSEESRMCRTKMRKCWLCWKDEDHLVLHQLEISLPIVAMVAGDVFIISNR